MKNVLTGKKSGFYISLGSAILGLVTGFLYLGFGLSSGTFEIPIAVCLFAGALLGFSLIFLRGLAADIAVVGMVALFTAALGLFLFNSIDDFADYFSHVQLYGNMENAPVRFALIAVELATVLVALLGSFFKRETNK